MNFDNLRLIDPLLRSMRAVGYHTPTDIQRMAIPHILARRDLVGCAQTGTGKTAAFVLPILQQLEASRPQRPRTQEIRVLVLSPTRELAAQIGQSFRTYGQFLSSRCAVVFGGVGQGNQVRELRQRPQILVATPGRLLDLISQGFIELDRLEIFVLDEADRMLDMGFIHDVRRVVDQLPRSRQTLMFSATMEPQVVSLAQRLLHDPVHVAATPSATRALVFTRTKHGANKLVKHLEKASIQAIAIHGNKSQSAREQALARFKAGHIRVLVATDIAARGLDVDDISHVINYELPEVPETYVHRIGRTARAGAAGVSFSFCDESECVYLRQIERLTRTAIPVARSTASRPRGQVSPREARRYPGRGAPVCVPSGS
ncbi:MAG: DEAD/DEAH box helicase [Candidatus Riflebacteria bacterium]|nr:DEAD/DEAH box helicase [Candidatus Riflebacteria bacterium]